jgi:hypothetical protein
MRARAVDLVIVVLGVVSMIGMPAAAPAASPDWKAVEQALGKSGQANDNPAKLAQGLKAALDQTNSQH